MLFSTCFFSFVFCILQYFHNELKRRIIMDIDILSDTDIRIIRLVNTWKQVTWDHEELFYATSKTVVNETIERNEEIPLLRNLRNDKAAKNSNDVLM